MSLPPPRQARNPPDSSQKILSLLSQGKQKGKTRAPRDFVYLDNIALTCNTGSMRVVNPVGKLGEDLASEYLRKHEYKIIERNFHAKGGEIDLIAIENISKEPVLCFIEVKTRTSSSFGTPLEAITPWKLHFIEKTAIYYTILHKNLPKSLRIDAISVVLGKNNSIKALEHMKNIGM